jgi:hypothetical protein
MYSSSQCDPTDKTVGQSPLLQPLGRHDEADEPLSRCNIASAGDSFSLNDPPGGIALISSSNIIVSNSCLIATVEGSLILRPKRWFRMDASAGEWLDLQEFCHPRSTNWWGDRVALLLALQLSSRTEGRSDPYCSRRQIRCQAAPHLKQVAAIGTLGRRTQTARDYGQEWRKPSKPR